MREHSFPLRYRKTSKRLERESVQRGAEKKIKEKKSGEIFSTGIFFSLLRRLLRLCPIAEKTASLRSRNSTTSSPSFRSFASQAYTGVSCLRRRRISGWIKSDAERERASSSSHQNHANCSPVTPSLSPISCSPFFHPDSRLSLPFFIRSNNAAV